MLCAIHNIAQQPSKSGQTESDYIMIDLASRTLGIRSLSSRIMRSRIGIIGAREYPISCESG